MKRNQTQKIGDLLNDFVKQNHMEQKLREVDVLQYWPELIGPALGRYIRSLHIDKKVLYVDVTSSVARAELYMLREEFRSRLNEKAGVEAIVRIEFR